MGIEDLTQLEIIDGIMGIIYPILGLIVGLTIMSKYSKYKRIELLFVGLSLATVGLSYFATGLTFITVVFYDYVLDDTTFFIIYFGIASVPLIGWMYAMSILLAPQHTKKIVSVYAVLVSLYEIFILVAIFTNPSLIATRISKMDVDRTLIMGLWTIFSLTTVLITMILFVRNCLKSKDLKIVWKGRFLLISTILLVAGGLIIALDPADLTIIIMSRIFIVSRLFFSYIGWLMPERVANFLIKKKE